ncbi:MAG: HEPN domain-containing protein [Bacteroidales bacterium]|nr:HEPN domain-containing protein [Bacteroidales bacterium]
MIQQQRALLVNKEARRAKDLLQQAKETFGTGHLDMAVNRCYYACYHLVQGLFIKNVCRPEIA